MRPVLARIGRYRRPLLLAGVVAGALGVSAGTALAAAPQLSIAMTHGNEFGEQHAVDPYTLGGETFGRESAFNTYTITASNDGSGATTGAPVTVIDKLPPGIVLLDSLSSSANSGRSPEQRKEEEKTVEVLHGPEWICNVATDATSVECSTSKVLEAGQSYTPIALHTYVEPSPTWGP